MIAGVVHSYGKTMAASPFPTPKMASRMVRQDWGKWNLDIVFPMVYHTFYTEDVSFISDCTVENVRDKNDKTVLYCGMTATDGPEMFECMDAALNSGAQGIAVFTVAGLRSSEVKNRFKTYTDSVRAVRAANGGIIEPILLLIKASWHWWKSVCDGLWPKHPVKRSYPRWLWVSIGKRNLTMPPVAIGWRMRTAGRSLRLLSTSTVMYFRVGT